MPGLIVTEQGSRISVKAKVFVVERGGSRVMDVPASKVDRVLLFGAIEPTSAFIRLALSEGIDVSFFTRNGRYRGRLVGEGSRNSRLRVAQILALSEECNRVLLARGCILGKLTAHRTLLLRAARRRPCESLQVAAATVRQLMERLPKTSDVDRLRGFEGAAARAWFGAFPDLILNPRFEFNGRNRRPPKDPINACLSFGYALLASTVESVVHRVGLDPMVGGLHELGHGRPSLVLDLMEEWRPVLVDSLVLTLINRRQLTPDDFVNVNTPDLIDQVLAGDDPDADDAESDVGVHLAGVGRKVLIGAFMKSLKKRVILSDRGISVTQEAAIEEQARVAARFIQGKTSSYRPHLTR